MKKFDIITMPMKIDGITYHRCDLIKTVISDKKYKAFFRLGIYGTSTYAQEKHKLFRVFAVKWWVPFFMVIWYELVLKRGSYNIVKNLN